MIDRDQLTKSIFSINKFRECYRNSMRGDGAGVVDGLAESGGEEVLRRSHGRGGQHGDGEDAGKLEYGIKDH